MSSCVGSLVEFAFHVVFDFTSPSEWFRLHTACALTSSQLSKHLGCRERLDAVAHPKLDLSRVAVLCPNLKELRIQRASDALLSSLACSLVGLRSLVLRECVQITDFALFTVFCHCQGLEVLEMSQVWSSILTDAPFAAAPRTLREVKAWGCSRLTCLSMHLLSRQCPNLEVLTLSPDASRSIPNHRFLASSVRCFLGLRELRCMDVFADDIFVAALATLPALSVLQVTSMHGRCPISDRGVACLARGLKGGLKELSLDLEGEFSALALNALGQECFGLKELELRHINGGGSLPIDASLLQLPPALLELNLRSCGLRGEFDCSQLTTLRALWLYGNPNLESIRCAGQRLHTLNIGATRCSNVEGAIMDGLELLDLADLGLADEGILPFFTPFPARLRKLVLGGNAVSAEFLLGLLSQAQHLSHLNVARCPARSVVELLNALSEPSQDGGFLAPSLQVIEASPEASVCWDQIDEDLEKHVDFVLEPRYTSPYGRPHDCDTSW
mmetsp:Transcript_10025/g.22457  ORF Transcript_10025/g.22457 Transcript_10025/m.22457 type:complete len:501 (-) Transcript_10025:181-1683(-)